jgi:hypothetical protein
MVDFATSLSPRALGDYIKTLKQIADGGAPSPQWWDWHTVNLVRNIYLVGFNLVRAGIPLPPKEEVLEPIERIASSGKGANLKNAQWLVTSLYEYQEQGEDPELTLSALAVPQNYYTSNQISLESEISFFANFLEKIQHDLSVESIWKLSTSARAIEGIIQHCFLLDGYLLEFQRDKVLYHISRALQIFSSSPILPEEAKDYIVRLELRYEKLKTLTKEMVQEEVRKLIESIDASIDCNED